MESVYLMVAEVYYACIFHIRNAVVFVIERIFINNFYYILKIHLIFIMMGSNLSLGSVDIYESPI